MSAADSEQPAGGTPDAVDPVADAASGVGGAEAGAASIKDHATDIAGETGLTEAGTADTSGEAGATEVDIADAAGETGRVEVHAADASPADSSASEKPAKRLSVWPNIVMALVVAAGLLIGSYPAMAQWFARVSQGDSLHGYAIEVESDAKARSEIFEAARAYNDAIPPILITDPYSGEDARKQRDSAIDIYEQALRLPGTDVMATITIPELSLTLPIYHGTDESTLARGAGHLFGTSLPVGGDTSHSVITAHTAYAGAKMFDDLPELQVGDLFIIEAAGERLGYRVDRIDTVLPEDVSMIQLEPGRDLVTLVTCTPPTVNSHRLLVRGERTELPREFSEGTLAVQGAGFPWWVLWVVPGLCLIAFGTYITSKPEVARRWLAARRKKDEDPAKGDEPATDEQTGTAEPGPASTS